MSKKLLSKLAVGAAVAGAAGYVVGILSAPAAGKKTRKQLAKNTANAYADLEKQLKQMHTELDGLMKDVQANGAKVSDDVEQKVAGAVEQAGKVRGKLREVLSSVHEGEASDKDLKKAVGEAKAALDHLKKFIQK